MPTHGRRVALLLAVGLAAFTTACGGDDTETSAGTTAPAGAATTEAGASTATTATESTKLTLGISPFQDTLLPVIAEKKGWFKEEGLDVEIKTLGWEAIMPAVAAKQVDVAINNTTGVISVAAREPEVVYWYGWNPFTQGAALIAGKDSGLKTVAALEAGGMSHEEAVREALTQLKGKKIVTTLTSDMGKAVNDALLSVGLSLKDVQIVDLNPDQGLAAFLSGTGDAFLGGIPQRARAEKEGLQVIASGPDLAPPPINGFVTTSSFAEKNQDAMLALLHVMLRTVRHCNDNTEECGKTITDELNKSTGSNLTVADYTSFWQKIENYAGSATEVQEAILDPSGYAYWKKTWDSDNRFLAEQQKSIPAPVDAQKHFWGDKVQELYIAKYGAGE